MPNPRRARLPSSREPLSPGNTTVTIAAAFQIPISGFAKNQNLDEFAGNGCQKILGRTEISTEVLPRRGTTRDALYKRPAAAFRGSFRGLGPAGCVLALQRPERREVRTWSDLGLEFAEKLFSCIVSFDVRMDFAIRIRDDENALKAVKDMNNFSLQISRCVYNFPDPSNFHADLDEYFRKPLGPIKPHVKVAVHDGFTFYRAGDIAVYVTENAAFRGAKKLAVSALAADTTAGPGVWDAKDGGTFIAGRLLKGFVLLIPCPVDGVDKRVAVCNRLVSLLKLGVDMVVYRREVLLSPVAPPRPRQDPLAREVERRKIDLTFRLAECEEWRLSLVSLMHECEASVAGRHRFSEAVKGRRAMEEMYVDSSNLLSLLSVSPLPLKSPPAWLHDEEALRESEIPPTSPRLRVALMEEEMSASAKEYQDMKGEIASLRAQLALLSVDKRGRGGDKGGKENAPPVRSPPPPSPPASLYAVPSPARTPFAPLVMNVTINHPPSPSMAAYTPPARFGPLAPLALFPSPLEAQVGAALDSVRGRVSYKEYDMLENLNLRRQWNGETDAEYARRIYLILQPLAHLPSVCEVANALFRAQVFPPAGTV
eukprot:jgi/Mesvir1/24151/Mv10868-RA.1